MPDAHERRSVLDDAPWNCGHGNYEFKCAGCWEALIGQSKKASEWREALEEVRSLVRELRIELATLTPKERDDRQLFLLEQADDAMRKLFDA